MATRLYANNYSDTLNGAISNSTTTIVVNDASGLPSLSGGDFVLLTIDNGVSIEIVKVTAISTNTLTVTRAQEGTSGTAFADNTVIECRTTAASFDFIAPVSTAPSLSTDGEIEIDSSVTDWSHGIMNYYGGETLGVVAMPIAQFTSPTDGYVVAYNATNDEFELVAGGGTVTTSGTPANNQFAVWTDATTIEGISQLTFDGTTLLSTATIDFGGATSFEIPNGAAPTVNAAGEIAVDTTITDYTGLIKYHDGTEELTVVAMPTANLSTTDGDVVKYNATNNEFEMGTGGAVTFEGAQVKKTGTQNISTSTTTTLTWDAENFDSNTLHDTSTNNERITIASAGKYLISANIIFSSNNTGARQIILRKNGSSLGSIIFDNTNIGEDQTFFFWIDDASASDYYDCQVWQDSGSTLTVGTSSVFTVTEIK